MTRPYLEEPTANLTVMKTSHTRREFLADVGRGILVASVGLEVASELNLTAATRKRQKH